MSIETPIAVTTAARTGGGREAAARRVRAPRSRVAWHAYLYIAPALAISVAFLGVPLAQTAWYSLWEWNGFSDAEWVGFENYADIVTDTGLRASFLHSGALIFFYSALPVVIGLALTAVLSRNPRMRGLSAFRTLLFLPQVIASVVVATMWLAIYSPDGLLNQLLRLVGLGGLTQAWLGSGDTALPAVGLIGTWLGVGLCLVLFLSGVANIDTEVFEAARLDGAGLWREFFGITLPALRPQIAVALTLTVISALKTFDLVYVTTRGGPGTATTVPAFEAYNRAFNTREVGSAAAVAVVLALLIAGITVLISRLQTEDAE